ncbi:tail tape measure protein [Elizabethkingia phage TCUEAP1]|nr:tail tape measure protein [Elizabethkingia phage TCUEAP1]
MADKIDLGTFDWNLSGLESKIAKNRADMEAYRVALDLAKKSLKLQADEMKAAIVTMGAQSKMTEELNNLMEDGTITQQEYNDAIEEMDKQMAEARETVQRTSDEMKGLSHQINNTEVSIRDLRLEQNELNKLLAAGREDADDSQGAYRELNKELNALKTEAKNLGAELYLLEQDGKKNTEEYQRLEAQYKETAKKADDLNTVFKKLDKSVGDNQRSVGSYAEAIQGATDDIIGGFQKMLRGEVIGGFQAIVTGFQSIKAAAIETMAYLLANPITAAIAAITGAVVAVGAAVKQVYDYNMSIKENIKLVQDLTGATGRLSDEIRLQAEALSNAFGDEFKDVLLTANTIATQLGLTFDKTFDIIQQGYVKGANASGDFLERLKEYGPLLSNYGFTLEEIIGLQIQSQEVGVFNDKFEDALKEAGLSLEEFTKAQIDALENAFGKEFATKLAKDINDGTLSVKDSLIVMATEAKKQGLSVQQFGKITADVFKGAGEDAGGALFMFDNLGKGVKKLNEPLTELQEKTLEVAEANKALAIAKDNALKSDKMQAFISTANKLWIEFKTGFFEVIGVITKFVSIVDDTLGITDSMFELFDTGKEYVQAIKEAFDEVVTILNDLAEAFGINSKNTSDLTKFLYSLVNPIKYLQTLFAALTLVVKGISGALKLVRVDFAAFANTVVSIMSQLANAIKKFDFSSPLESLKRFNDISVVATYAKQRAEIVKNIEVQKALNAATEAGIKAIKNTPTFAKATNKTGGETEAERQARLKAEEDARKKAEADRKKAAADAERDRKKAAADALKEAEAEAKRAVEIAKEKQAQTIDIAKSELSEYIASNAQKLASDKRLNADRLKELQKYYDEVLAKQKEINKADADSKNFAIQQKIDELLAKKTLNDNDKKDLLNLRNQQKQINADYRTADQQAENENAASKRASNEKFEADERERVKIQRAIDYQEKINDLEAQNASEYELQRTDALTRKEEDLAQIELDRQEELLSIEQYNLAKKNVEDKYRNDTRKLDKAELDAKLAAYGDTFGGIAKLLGEQTAAGKAAAIAQIALAQGQAVARVWSEPSVLPQPFATINRVIQTGVAVGTVAKALKDAQSVKAARGMEIVGPSHSEGGVPVMTPNGMIEAEGGELIINKRSSAMFRPQLSAINQAGGGVKFARGGEIGGSGLSAISSSFGVNMTPQEAAQLMADAVADGSFRGTNTGTTTGYQNMTTDIEIATDANF